MTITIDLRPEIEIGLVAQAEARGVSLRDYVTEIVADAAHVRMVEAEPQPRTGQALIDVCAEIRGVLTDEEIDTMFARNRSMSRSVEL
jgi:hypothetical protein